MCGGKEEVEEEDVLLMVSDTVIMISTEENGRYSVGFPTRVFADQIRVRATSTGSRVCDPVGFRSFGRFTKHDRPRRSEIRHRSEESSDGGIFEDRHEGAVTPVRNLLRGQKYRFAQDHGQQTKISQ